jgi:hypothetical protein
VCGRETILLASADNPARRVLSTAGRDAACHCFLSGNPQSELEAPANHRNLGWPASHLLFPTISHKSGQSHSSSALSSLSCSTPFPPLPRPERLPSRVGCCLPCRRVISHSSEASQLLDCLTACHGSLRASGTPHSHLCWPIPLNCAFCLGSHLHLAHCQASVRSARDY